MKRVLTILLTIAMLVSLVATVAVAEEKTYKIGILFCTSAAPSVKYSWDTAEAYAKELGNVELICFDGELDGPKQADQALNLISMGVDLIIINPADASSFSSTAQLIDEAGIPMITWVQPLDEEGASYQECFIGASDELQGHENVRKMAELAGEDASIVLIEGALGSSAQIVREAAIRAYAAENYPNMKILDAQCTSWDRETGRTVMEDFISKYGEEIDGVIAWDDNIAIGAIEALQKVDRADDVVVLGYCTLIDAKPYLESGELNASIPQDLLTSIKLAIDVAVKVIDGEEVEEAYWDELYWVEAGNIEDGLYLW